MESISDTPRSQVQENNPGEEHVTIIDAPGTAIAPEDLSDEERRQYDRFLVGLRQLHAWGDDYKQQVVGDLLAKVQAGHKLADEWMKHQSAAEALGPLVVIRHPSAKAVEAALRTVLAETRPVPDWVDKLLPLEAEIRAIVAHLDSKTRLTIAALVNLAELADPQFTEKPIRVDWGWPLLYDEALDSEAVESAIETLRDDPDAQTLAKVYRLTEDYRQAIKEAAECGAGRRLPLPAVESEFDAEAESDPEPETEPAAQSEPEPTDGALNFDLDLERAHGSLRLLVAWLLRRSDEEKVAALALQTLIDTDTQSDIKESGLYDGDIGQDLSNTWGGEILDRLADKNVRRRFNPETLAVASYIAGLEANHP